MGLAIQQFSESSE